MNKFFVSASIFCFVSAIVCILAGDVYAAVACGTSAWFLIP